MKMFYGRLFFLLANFSSLLAIGYNEAVDIIILPENHIFMDASFELSDAAHEGGEMRHVMRANNISDLHLYFGRGSWPSFFHHKSLHRSPDGVSVELQFIDDSMTLDRFQSVSRHLSSTFAVSMSESIFTRPIISSDNRHISQHYPFQSICNDAIKRIFDRIPCYPEHFGVSALMPLSLLSCSTSAANSVSISLSMHYSHDFDLFSWNINVGAIFLSYHMFNRQLHSPHEMWKHLMIADSTLTIPICRNNSNIRVIDSCSSLNIVTYESSSTDEHSIDVSLLECSHYDSSHPDNDHHDEHFIDSNVVCPDITYFTGEFMNNGLGAQIGINYSLVLQTYIYDSEIVIIHEFPRFLTILESTYRISIDNIVYSLRNGSFVWKDELDTFTTLTIPIDTPRSVSLSISYYALYPFLAIEDFPFDASRGFEIPPIIIKTRGCDETKFGPSLLAADHPQPDFSMPFNVATLITTCLAFLLGSFINLLARGGRNKKKKWFQRVFDSIKRKKE